MSFLHSQCTCKTQLNIAMDLVATLWFIPSEIPVWIWLPLWRCWKVRPLRDYLVIWSNVGLSHRSRVAVVRVDCYKVSSAFFVPLFLLNYYVFVMHKHVKISSPEPGVMLLDYQSCELKLTFFLYRWPCLVHQRNQRKMIFEISKLLNIEGILSSLHNVKVTRFLQLVSHPEQRCGWIGTRREEKYNILWYLISGSCLSHNQPPTLKFST